MQHHYTKIGAIALGIVCTWFFLISPVVHGCPEGQKLVRGTFVLECVSAQP
jgi:hypothetical protein